MAAMKWRRHQRDRSARTRDPHLDALEPRVLFSGSGHSLACGHLVTPEQALAGHTDVNVHAAASLDLSQTFKLHSLPGARHTIYLDFNGHTTSGTYWNTHQNGGKAFTTPAYSTDGSPAFSAPEQTNIQHIWQRVAEDFAPFAVNVTTQEPPLDALRRTGSGDTAWGIRVVIGGSSTQWYGPEVGGVAYLNSFTWNTDTPVFVFEDQLGNGHEKYVAEAVSHEVGHALGLDHDGGSGAGYYRGHGHGDSGWAPVMGSGYDRNLTQWSRGEYAGATNTQDDLWTITTQNGFGYRPDDTGNTPATATPLSFSGSVITATGIIERNTDADVYSFTTRGGAVDFTVRPAPRGPNLDVLAEILDATGRVITSANPAGLLSASVGATLAAGTYYLRISGGAEPNGGYSSYGSLGQYTVTGNAQAARTPPTLSLNNTAHYEGNGWARMSILLSEPSDSPVSVVWGTAAGTARVARDYNARAGFVVFQPGQTQKFIYVRVIEDALREATERFWVGLTSPTGAALGRAWGSMYILDNEPGAAARRAAQAKASAAVASPASSSAAAWQLQQSQRAAGNGFAWSSHTDNETDDAIDILAHLPAAA